MREPKYKRVLLKISGEALAGDAHRGLDFAVIGGVCDVIRQCVEAGVQVGVVVGGGNFWRGVKDGGGKMERTRADHMGMLATVINALAVADCLEQRGVEVRVQTAIAMNQIAEPYIRQSVKNSAIDIAAVAALLQARCEKLTEIPEKVDFLDALPEYDVSFFTNKKSKTDSAISLNMLREAIPALEGISIWSQEAVHDTLIALAERLGVKNATLMWPVRIAVAGKLVTPGGAVELCHILGRDETLRRLRFGMKKLEG